MKYMGSKQKIANEIYKTICELEPRNGRPWVEPFAGGMNMICNVPESEGARYANDCNKYLIAMFKALSSGWEPPLEVSKEFYLKCKNLEAEDHIVGYVGFNCSYSGKWFGGYAGKTETKIGTIRDYQKEAFNNVKKQIAKMKEVYYCNASYVEIEIPENSIVYCDPPYANTTGYKDSFDSKSFWEWVRITSKNNSVYVSEYVAPSDFECVWQKELKSSLSANGASGQSKTSIERLFRLKKK